MLSPGKMVFTVNFDRLKKLRRWKKDYSGNSLYPTPVYAANYKSPYRQQLEKKRSAPSRARSAPAPERRRQLQRQQSAPQPVPQEEMENSLSSIDKDKKPRHSAFLSNPTRLSVAAKRREGTRIHELNEISGYFIHNVLNPGTTNRKSRRHSKIIPRKSRKSEVTFPEEMTPMPHGKIEVRDGSIALDLQDIADLPKWYFPPEDSEEQDEKSDLAIYNYVEKLDRSLDQIRTLRDTPAETLKEYDYHRKRFMRSFAVHIPLTMIACLVSLFFIFYYNFGFSMISTEEERAANETLRRHEKQRIYINAHMLIMVIPTTNLFAVSTLIFRIFPSKSRASLRWYHGIINIIGAIFSFTGLFFAVLYHEEGSKHFTSLHSYLGLSAILHQTVALCTGFTFILPFCNWEKRLCISPFHQMAGSLLLMGDAACILTGCVTISNKYFNHLGFPQFYHTPYNILHARSVCLNFVGLTCLTAVGGMLFLQTNYVFRHRKRPNQKPEDKGKENEDVRKSILKQSYFSRKRFSSLDETNAEEQAAS